MVNPSALGVAFLVLLATTTMVGSSSKQQSFQVSHPSLGDLLLNDAVRAMAGTYHRQTHTISLEQGHVAAAQRLAVQVPEGVRFQGTLTINGTRREQVSPEGLALDLSSVLAQGETQVTLEGTYSPPDANIMVSFESPETTVQQRVGQQGAVHYHIEFRID